MRQQRVRLIRHPLRGPHRGQRSVTAPKRPDIWPHRSLRTNLSIFTLARGAVPHMTPWRSFEAVEVATLTWVDWFNNRRLLEPIGNIPPAEAEERYYAMLSEPAMRAW